MMNKIIFDDYNNNNKHDRDKIWKFYKDFFIKNNIKKRDIIVTQLNEKDIIDIINNNE